MRKTCLGFQWRQEGSFVGSRLSAFPTVPADIKQANVFIQALISRLNYHAMNMYRSVEVQLHHL
jgi:hypothetical protein